MEKTELAQEYFTTPKKLDNFLNPFVHGSFMFKNQF